MARSHGHKINKIAIFNPINGIWNQASIENWDKGNLLENFLIKKAE